MDRSLAALTYKGSIPEAIFEAKRQKKIFVVYISGEDAESTKLEESIWNAATVGESVLKYCVLLHIHEGSTDAANFSAIYPYNSIPCITAIGFNGAQVWKNEGSIAADDLASTLEKAWLSLHIQETTVILSAAIASQKSQPSTSSLSSTAASTEGSSSDVTVPSPFTAIHSSEREPLVTSATTKENDAGTDAVKGNETDNNLFSECVGPSKPIDIANDLTASSAEEANEKLAEVKDKGSSSDVETENDPIHPVTTESEKQSSIDASCGCEDITRTSGKSVHHDSGVLGRDTNILASKEETPYQKNEATDDRNKGTVENSQSINKSTVVHLNIRLPDGVSFQEKFAVTSALRMVKDYVDSNLTNAIGSYDLAIPYPRKVFSDQDLSKSLSGLGLFNRQALIAVPRQRATAHLGLRSSSTEKTNTNSENERDSGYFTYLRRVLSYVNPFSYFGGDASSSNSGSESQTRMWENGLGNNLAQADRTSRASSSTTDTNGVQTRRPTTSSRIGSNIHALKHDKDDQRFGDRNVFWNGNSTQYGGDNNGR